MEYLEIPASYDEVLVLSLIVGKGYYRLVDLMRATGFVKTRVLRIISRIREKWRLGVDVDYSRIGLRRLLLILEDMPKTIIEPDFLAVVNRSIKGYIVLSYYVPVSYDYRRLVDYYDPVEYYLFDKVLYPKPNLLRYYDRGSLKINLYRELENVFSSTSSIVDQDFHLSEQSVLKRFTVLDIRIIDALMKNAFTSIKKIAEALGEPSSKIASHVRMLREYKVFNGFFIKRYPIKPLGKLALGVVYIIKTNSLGEAAYLAKRFQEIPFFGATYLSVKEKLLLIQLSVREKMLSMVPTISSILKRNIEEIDRTLIVSPLRGIRRVPEEKTYDKYEKQWIFNIN